MTIFFNSNDLQLYRHRRRTNSNRYALSATLTVFQADIQPAGLERTQFVDGRIGATYTAYVDSSIVIREGDQMVDTASGKRYSVRGVTQWDGAGILDHLEITLVSEDGNV